MGAADDIKKGLTEGLKTFTKQRKAEEKQSSNTRWRQSRMVEVRGKFLKEAAEEVMEEAYMKASGNNSLPAMARQVFYVARTPIEDQTDKPLRYDYFSQTLLPDYVREHGKEAEWDVVYDDRGHFAEPHNKRIIGLGTLNVRAYLSRVKELEVAEADFDPAGLRTYGPSGSYGAVLYVEKEGFLPLFKRVKLAKRYDLAIMSSKGMAVTAARDLVDSICSEYDIPLLVLHDFDSAGIIIRDTLENDTRRHIHKGACDVIDLGLTFADIGGLSPEPNNSNISSERLSEAGLNGAAIDFLRGQRVELNAMTSPQLVEFVERKLQQHGIKKVIPDDATLKETYEAFVKSDRLSEAFDKMKEDFDDDDNDDPIEAPKNLGVQVKKKMKEQPDITWYRALELVIDPDAPVKEKNKDEDEDDEDEAEDEDGDAE
jgi:hypothetical protein